MKTLRLLAICGLAAPVSAQVVINEVWENPPGDGDIFDPALEYIELYGEPGTDLTGWAVAQVKGGSDPNGDNIPSGLPEIDEAFSLDGLSIGANGFLVLFNNTGGFSDIPFLLPPGAASAGFVEAHIPSGDVAGKLANDGSSTYMLVRRRPNHSVVGGASVYGPEYAFKKDTVPDVNFDGKVDFGFEPTVAGGAAQEIDPMQQIDDIAWSNAGGKEYVRSSEQEISDTPGFNPDAISRVAYFGQNPMAGLRINSEGATVPTRTADEEFVYGEQGPEDGAFTYLTTDSGAPTDPNGDGFLDLSVAGFALTPGNFNDGGVFTQFRFVRGDFDFNSAVDSADGDLIAARVGQHLDVRTDCLDEFGLPVMIGGEVVQCYLYEGRAANALLAMMNMDKTDGPGGTNADEVTQADLDAWNNEFGPAGCNPADLAEAFGILDLNDISTFIGGFVGMDPVADLAAPFGVFDLNDISTFIAAFTGGCP